MNNKICLYFNTLKYLKPVQVYGRLFSKIKNILPQHPPSSKRVIVLNSFPYKKYEFNFHDSWNNEPDLESAVFNFLNVKKNIGFPPDWNVDAKLLWKFNLHYFNWLHLLQKEKQSYFIDSWIEANKYGYGVGWHPYVTSLRIVSWCKNGVVKKEHLESLYLQAHYLYRNMEYYHPANHYLENGRALIFAGLYLSTEESKLWIKRGFQIFEQELDRQVLCDGAYFELSPMYHCIILEGLLDIINIIPEGVNIEIIKEYSFKMLRYLESIVDDCYRIPLFNDSTYEIAPKVESLIEYGRKLGILVEKSSLSTENNYNTISIHHKASGLYIVKDKNIYLAVDGGVIGPDMIPAHAHADIFTYELKIKNYDFIVDSGVYEYNAGEIRTYSRSTKAHNCLSIDGIDQAEVWDSFRVGRRYRPENVTFDRHDNLYEFQGLFSGYSKLIGDDLVHKRSIIYDAIEKTIDVKDCVTGYGKHIAESYIHLHPNTKIESNSLGFLIIREGIDVALQINCDESKIIEGLYSPCFGCIIPNKILVLKSNTPAEINYKFKIQN